MEEKIILTKFDRIMNVYKIIISLFTFSLTAFFIVFLLQQFIYDVNAYIHGALIILGLALDYIVGFVIYGGLGYGFIIFLGFVGLILSLIIKKSNNKKNNLKYFICFIIITILCYLLVYALGWSLCYLFDIIQAEH